jgi:hypothetical protein
LWSNVTALNRTRQLWKAVSGWIEQRDPANAWARNYDNIYVEAQVMRVVRTVITGRRPGHVALKSVLRHFAQRPEVLGTIESYRNLVGIVNPGDPLGDLSHLTDVIRCLIPLRDKRIAHTDLDSDLDSPLGWEDLDRAIDGVSEVFRHYSARLTGVNYQVDNFSKPRWNTWQALFAEPLLSSEEPPDVQGE